VHGERIKQARELCGLTQMELAQRAGVRQSAIAQIESNIYVPSDTVLHGIAIHTGFDVGFLKQDRPPAEFPIGSFLYRAQAKVSGKERAQAHRTAQLMFEIALIMRSRLVDIPVLIPRTNEPPEVAAQITRASLGFSPESPISNLMSAVERAGVLVLKLPLVIDGLDGFSSWVGLNHDIPMICLMSGKKGYRQRFTLAEELCHLVKHTPLRCSVADADDEARRFVGEMLLPAETIREEISHPITLSSLWAYRARHQVSLQFLIRRVLDLEMVTPNQYKYLMMQVSAKGWRKEEPGDAAIVQEEPKMFSKMVNVVYGNPPDLQLMKRETGGVPIPMLRNLLSSLPPSDPGTDRKVLSFQKKAS
jgi:Zn-dependent peptidase ImmA (M78 family)/transcriptional regulator with XRE-family HTH domain